MSRIASVVALVLAISCSKRDGGGEPPAKSGEPAPSSDRQAPASSVPIGVAAGKGLAAPAAGGNGPADSASGEVRRVAATPVQRATSAPRGLFDALVTKGKRWELRNAEGERLIVETDQVHTVGKARVARLRWSHDGPDGLDRDYYGGWPQQVAVTDQGLLVMDRVADDDRELAALLTGKPQYPDPPRIDQPNQSYYTHLVDDMVCIGFDYWVTAGDDGMCGDESCTWRVCLRPGEIVGADGAGSDDLGPVEYTSASRPSQRSVSGALDFTASSEHARWKSYTFDAGLLGDRRLATCWQPAKGKAVGEWVEVRAEPGAPMVLDAIEIANGYQSADELGDLFLLNARVRTATLALDGKPEVIVDFAEDQRGYLRVELGGKTATTVRLTIDEIWAGKKWQDVAISELGLYRRASPE